ncbi:MAG: hypothetical protein ACE5EJ_04770 [Nitrosopumilaceae archaeon]
MPKRCWGITKKFKRCTSERMLIPVCNKHIWQFIQLLVFLLTFGAILITLKLYHIYEGHLHVIQQSENSGIKRAEKQKEDQVKRGKYEKWEE